MGGSLGRGYSSSYGKDGAWIVRDSSVGISVQNGGVWGDPPTEALSEWAWCWDWP